MLMREHEAIRIQSLGSSVGGGISASAHWRADSIAFF
jgi:hypothetical protein